MATAEYWLLHRERWHARDLVLTWEKTFADWLGVETASAWLGGRASLYAAVLALQLQAGDEVILPAFTCQCVVNAFRYHRIDIVYADIEAETYGIDAKAAAQMITPKTKAILIQYSFGLVSRDIEALLDLARRHRLYVIEDCAHALGARWQGKRLGTLGDVAIFSSERSKIINTIHGGLVTSNHREIGERLKCLRRKAAPPAAQKTEKLLNTVIHDYHVHANPDREHTRPVAEAIYAGSILPQMFPEEFAGTFTPHYTESINTPIAALALNQFAKMEGFHQRRIAAAAHWREWCLEQGFRVPVVIDNSVPTFLRYPVCVPEEKKTDRAWIEETLNITAGVWFTSAAHPVPLALAHCPVGAKAARECINLPTLLPPEYLDRRHA